MNAPTTEAMSGPDVSDIMGQLLSEEGLDVRSMPSDTTDEELQKLLAYPDFQRAGGRLVRGEPWREGVEQTSKDRVFFSDQEYDRFAGALTQEVKEKHLKEPFTAVVTLPTGGVGLGSRIAGDTGLPLHYLHATAYDANGEKGELSYSEAEIDDICEGLPKGSRILLVDDLSDSGQALLKTKAAFERRGMIVVTAAIFAKKRTEHIPDICLYPGYPDVWIVQPTEKNEGDMRGHNVYQIQEGPISDTIHDIASAVRSLMENEGTKYKKDLQFSSMQIVVPAGSDSDTVSALMTIAKDRQKFEIATARFVPHTGIRVSELTHKRDVGGLILGVKGNILFILPESVREIHPVTIAMHADGSFGVSPGHDLRGVCPDEPTKNHAATHGVVQSTQSDGITFYRTYASQLQIDELNHLSHSYHTSGSARKRYHDICESLITKN